jgi:anthranilate phosphoribosyltransferase
LAAADLSGLSVGSAQASARLIRAALSGRAAEDGDTDPDKARKIIAMNAGATIYVAGIASSLADGVALAEDLLSTGQAAEKLKAFVDMTQLMREEKSA